LRPREAITLRHCRRSGKSKGFAENISQTFRNHFQNSLAKTNAAAILATKRSRPGRMIPAQSDQGTPMGSKKSNPSKINGLAFAKNICRICHPKAA
jgi:hypothetical protein